MLAAARVLQADRVAHGRIKSLTPSPALAKEHYIDLKERPFYSGLVKYITSGTPVVAM